MKPDSAIYLVEGFQRWMHAKNQLDNIGPKALRSLRENGAWLVGLSRNEVDAIVRSGQLKEMRCDEEKEIGHR